MVSGDKIITPSTEFPKVGEIYFCNRVNGADQEHDKAKTALIEDVFVPLRDEDEQGNKNKREVI